MERECGSRGKLPQVYLKSSPEGVDTFPRPLTDPLDRCWPGHVGVTQPKERGARNCKVRRRHEFIVSLLVEEDKLCAELEVNNVNTYALFTFIH